MFDILFPALGETIYMSFVSTFFAVVIGFFLAIILIFTSKDGLKENLKEPLADYKKQPVI